MPCEGAYLLLHAPQDVGPVVDAVQRPRQHSSSRLMASYQHRHQVVTQLLARDLWATPQSLQSRAMQRLSSHPDLKLWTRINTCPLPILNSCSDHFPGLLLTVACFNIVRHVNMLTKTPRTQAKTPCPSQWEAGKSKGKMMTCTWA